jgi:hypothetical protein
MSSASAPGRSPRCSRPARPRPTACCAGRAAFEFRLPATGRERAPLPNSKRERDIVGRFADAIQAGNTDAVVALLTDDARLTMPPEPYEYQGRDGSERSCTTARSGAARRSSWRRAPTPSQHSASTSPAPRPRSRDRTHCSDRLLAAGRTGDPQHRRAVAVSPAGRRGSTSWPAVPATAIGMSSLQPGWGYRGRCTGPAADTGTAGAIPSPRS